MLQLANHGFLKTETVLNKLYSSDIMNSLQLANLQRHRVHKNPRVKTHVKCPDDIVTITAKYHQRSEKIIVSSLPCR